MSRKFTNAFNVMPSLPEDADPVDSDQTVATRYTIWALLPSHIAKLQRLKTGQKMDDTVDDAQALFDVLGSLHIRVSRELGIEPRHESPGIFRLIYHFRPTTTKRNDLLAFEALASEITADQVEEAINFYREGITPDIALNLTDYLRDSIGKCTVWASELSSAIASLPSDAAESRDEHVKRYFEQYGARVTEVMKTYEWKMTCMEKSYRSGDPKSVLGKRSADDV